MEKKPSDVSAGWLQTEEGINWGDVQVGLHLVGALQMWKFTT